MLITAIWLSRPSSPPEPRRKPTRVRQQPTQPFIRPVQPNPASVAALTPTQPHIGAPLTVHKTQIKFLHDPAVADCLQKRLKVDGSVRSRNLEPILRHETRHFVKNKTLYVLLRERTVAKCTLLEGELLRGLVADFSRYELQMQLKGGFHSPSCATLFSTCAISKTGAS